MDELLLVHTVPVLEDCVDQLAVLGACRPSQQVQSIMVNAFKAFCSHASFSTNNPSKKKKKKPGDDEEVGEIVRYQRRLEAEYDKVIKACCFTH